jgi:hypothetical protein
MRLVITSIEKRMRRYRTELRIQSELTKKKKGES